MKVALCGIAKLENNYIREWVEHYQQIGFDHIYLYDNNDPDGERFDEAIADYIQTGFVTIIDYRGRVECQPNAYTECYKQFGSEYDWMACFDIDEFLEIDGMDVKQFLTQPVYASWNAIKICWQCRTDNGILSPNGDYSVKKFTEVAKLSPKNHNNRQAKCICRTGKDLYYIRGHHCPQNLQGSICDTLGKQADDSNGFKAPKWNKAKIVHYRFKTIEEYVTNKMQRLYPDYNDEWSRDRLNLDFFFKVNERTKEKEEYAAELMKKLIMERIPAPKVVQPKSDKPMDILYIVGTGSKWHNNELRYSLRSIDKFGQNIGRIFIAINELPPFIDPEKVKWVAIRDLGKIKHLNIMNKVECAMRYTDIADDFLIASDDHFYIKPTDFANYPLYYKEEALRGRTEEYWASVRDTRKFLEDHGLTSLACNCHLFKHMNRPLYMENIALMDEGKKLHYGAEVNYLMGNLLIAQGVEPTLIKDIKIKEFKSREELLDQIGDSHFFSIFDSALNCGIKEYLREIFPNKSRWEK